MSKKSKEGHSTTKDQAAGPLQVMTLGTGDDFPPILPVLPAKDVVAFPGVTISLHIGRASSIKAIEAAQSGDKLIFITTQKDSSVESPKSNDLYKVGVIANVVRVLKLPEEKYKALFQGIARARAQRFRMEKGHFVADIECIPSLPMPELKEEDLQILQRIRKNIQLMVENEHLPEEMLLMAEDIDDPGVLSDVLLSHYKLESAFAQAALEELDPLKRLRVTDAFLNDNINQLMITEQIESKTREELTKGQQEYYLREQLRMIQRELGEGDGASADLAELKRNLEKVRLPKHAEVETRKQLQRLERMQAESSEYALLRTYLEWISDLPWSRRTRDQLDLGMAQSILDQDHFGLEKAKERILEYLSVRKLKRDSKGPILCLVGPPGVGKTSLGQSVARALSRKFFRMSLGGMRDEAEIRGHRRTYVGALPGRIIQGLKQVESKNPVFVLDELDKIGSDFRGDPSSALLEVLDPEQNKAFRDHYLNLDFDLSEVLFIGTANTIDTIPPALLDRLEIIYISSYTTEEKVNIAKRYLIPKQLQANGIGDLAVRIPDSAVRFLIERYTQEAGVRNLEREVGALCRKIARGYAERGTVTKKVSAQVVQKLLGTTKFDPEVKELKDLVGLVHGLAWTTHGGEVMPVEASIAPGTGKLNLTGQLGSVMQESAQAALFYARANTAALGLDPDFHEKVDVHIHVPAGATPKDGPSAGITICAALISALSNRRISHAIAMTGEITLRGNVLPVGGIKEKALAAIRYGIKTVVIPHENIKDLDDIPVELRSKVKWKPVKHIHEVLAATFIDDPRPPRANVKRRRKNVKPVLGIEM